MTSGQSVPDALLSAGWELRNAGLTLCALRGAAAMARIAALRGQSFGQSQADPFDEQSTHLVVAGDGGAVMAACRLRLHADGPSLTQGYTGQFYDLAGLAGIGLPLVELGRLCTAPGAGQALALRLLWAGIADLTGRWQARAIFGCASFPGADPGRHHVALAGLAARRGDEGGRGARAKVAADCRVALDSVPAAAQDAALPPLLRSYLSLGAWVGPDAVLDHDLNTLHVLTVLEIDRIPAPRRASLAAFVAAAGGRADDGQVDGAEHSA